MTNPTDSDRATAGRIATLSPEWVAEIRALAEKATPGPWEVDDEQNDGNFGDGPDCNSGYKSYAVIVGNKTVVDTLNSDLAEIEEDGDCEEGSWRYSRWDEIGRRNATFIAALDPQTVLALLASHEALRAEVERLNKWADGFDEASRKERLAAETYIKELRSDLNTARNTALLNLKVAKDRGAELTTARATAAREMRDKCVEWHKDEAMLWCHGPRPGTIQHGNEMAALHREFADKLAALPPAIGNQGARLMSDVEKVARAIARRIAKREYGEQYEGYESTHKEAADDYARAAARPDEWNAAIETAAGIVEETSKRPIAVTWGALKRRILALRRPAGEEG